MNYQPSLLLLTMILCSSPTKADNYTDATRPSLEFLEFLGEWETKSGDWIDPESFEDKDFVKLMNITDEENRQSTTRGVVSSHPQESQSATEND